MHPHYPYLQVTDACSMFFMLIAAAQLIRLNHFEAFFLLCNRVKGIKLFKKNVQGCGNIKK